MKSVEAYINELQPPEFYFSQRGTTRLIELAKQIQLDAIREGMRRAAALTQNNDFHGARLILSAAEQLTEKDL